MPFSSNDPRDYLAIGKQSAAGTEATTFKFIRFLTAGLDTNQENQTVYLGGDGQDPGFVYKGKVTADANLDTYSWPGQFAYLGAWAMGSAVAIASTGAVASHCYVPNSTVPLLTVEQCWGGGNNCDRVSDAIVTGFTVSGNSNEPWKISAQIMGGGTVYWRDGAASGLSPTLESGDPAMYSGGAYVLDGATSLDIRNWTYAFTRDADGDLYTVSPFRRTIVALRRNVTVNGQLLVQDSTLWKKAKYGGGTTVPFTVATGSFHAERVLTASQMLSIDVPNLDYLDVKVNSLEPDGQTLVYDFSAQGIKVGTGITQLRANITGNPTSFLL